MKDKTSLKSGILGSLKIIKSNKKIMYLLFALLLVIIFGVIFSNSSSIKAAKSNSSSVTTSDSLYLSYVTETEQRLTSVLNSVKSLSNVKVFINVSQSPKITYLSEEKKTNTDSLNGTIANTIVLAKDGTLTYPIVILEELPEIEGVLIVAKGAGDPKVKLEVSNIISSILGVSVSCIEVLEGK